MLPLASTSNRVTGVSVCVVPALDEPRVTAIRLPLSSSSVIRSPSPTRDDGVRVAAREAAEMGPGGRVEHALTGEERVRPEEDRARRVVDAAGREVEADRKRRVRRRELSVDVGDVHTRRARADAAVRRLDVEDVRADERVVASVGGERAAAGEALARVGAAARRGARRRRRDAVGGEPIVRRADDAEIVLDHGRADRVVDRPVDLDRAVRRVLDPDERRRGLARDVERQRHVRVVVALEAARPASPRWRRGCR